MLRGQLTPRAGIADVIRLIYTQRRSGVLHVQREPVKKKLYFEKGTFTFSETNEPGWKLGELLVSRGLVSADDMRDVLSLTGRGKRLGRVVREMGLLDEERLADCIRYQILENAYPVFAWTSGLYSFEEEEEPAAADIALALSTASVVMEGVRRIEDPELIRTALGSTDNIVVLGSNPLLRFQSIFLKPKEGFILSRIDGMLSVSEICSISSVPEDDTLKCLYGLFSAGILELRSQEEQAGKSGEEDDIAGFFTELRGIEDVVDGTTGGEERALTADEQREYDELVAFHAGVGALAYHDVLGVGPTAAKTEVRKAYYRLAKLYHPDRHLKGHLASLHDKLEQIFVRVNEAYEAMREGDYKVVEPRPQAASGAAPTSEAVDTESRLAAAEDSYRHGRQRYDDGDYFGAIQALRRAVNLNGDKPVYRAYLGRALAKNPKWRRESEQHLLKAVEMEPATAEHYAQLGQLYAAAGLPTKAERYFSEALNWDPSNQTALAGQGVLAADKESKKGLGASLKNLFNKKE